MNKSIALFSLLSFPIIYCASEVQTFHADEKIGDKRVVGFFSAHDGNNKVAKNLRDCMPKCFMKCMSSDDMNKSMKTLFSQFDTENKGTEGSASAFVVCVDNKKRAYCAHVGSIGALIIERDVQYDSEKNKFLMPPHKTTDSGEQERIESKGGKIWSGTAWGDQDCTGDGFKISRLIGGAALKQQYPELVIAEPDYTEVDVSADSHLMVIGSDKFWETIYPQDVYPLVQLSLNGDNYSLDDVKKELLELVATKGLGASEVHVVDLLSDKVDDIVPVQQKTTINVGKENRTFSFFKNLSTTTKVLGSMSIVAFVGLLYYFYQ